MGKGRINGGLAFAWGDGCGGDLSDGKDRGLRPDCWLCSDNATPCVFAALRCGVAIAMPASQSCSQNEPSPVCKSVFVTCQGLYKGALWRTHCFKGQKSTLNWL